MSPAPDAAGLAGSAIAFAAALAEVIRERCPGDMPAGAEAVFRTGTAPLYHGFYKPTGRTGPQFDPDAAVSGFAARLAALPETDPDLVSVLESEVMALSNQLFYWLHPGSAPGRGRD